RAGTAFANHIMIFRGALHDRDHAVPTTREPPGHRDERAWILPRLHALEPRPRSSPPVRATPCVVVDRGGAHRSVVVDRCVVDRCAAIAAYRARGVGCALDSST